MSRLGFEMLATCVGLLLDGASPEQQAQAAQSDPIVYAALSGMNPRYMIVSGLGVLPAESAGNPLRGNYGASGKGRWAQGMSIDGKGQGSYVADPQPHG